MKNGGSPHLFEWWMLLLRVCGYCIILTGPATPGGLGGHIPPPPLTFWSSKKGEKGKKERVSKQKPLKGCHQGQNIIVLAILERLEFENFSCRPTIVADNTFQGSIAPPL